jgi:hypothetical protein
MPNLMNLYKGARILEALENYSRAGDTSLAETPNSPSNQSQSLTNEYNFWDNILGNTDAHWDKLFNLQAWQYSEWTPRVPGLYWANSSESMRALTETEIHINHGAWIEFTPGGKSAQVIGGVGSLLLPPHNGMVIASVTSFGNASTGIPILISNTLKNNLELENGSVFSLKNVRWQRMSVEWATHFPSLRGIPNGYLVIEDESQISRQSNLGNIQYHPYSIMEYIFEDVLLWDFVYVTGESKKNDRSQLEDFFEYYRTKEGRKGKYLIAPDVSHPLFDAKYKSPDRLKESTYGEAQLQLIRRRIGKELFNGKTIEQFTRLFLKAYPVPENMRTVADFIAVPHTSFSAQTGKEMAIELVNYCLDNDKMDELIDQVALENPGLFKKPIT